MQLRNIWTNNHLQPRSISGHYTLIIAGGKSGSESGLKMSRVWLAEDDTLVCHLSHAHFQTATQE